MGEISGYMCGQQQDGRHHSSYHQTQRKTAPAKRNCVPFIKDVLRARELSGKGVYQYVDAEILSYGNMWRLHDKTYQHITISDGQTEVEVWTEIYEPTDAYDEIGWHILKLRWVESPTMGNLQCVIQEKIES